MQHPTSYRTASWALAAGFVLLLAAIIVAADRGAMPSAVHRLYGWPGGDKAGHVILLAALAALLDLALDGRRVRLGVVSPMLGSLIAAVAITGEELSQAWFPTRTLSLADLACSYLGIWLGGRVALAMLERVGRRQLVTTPSSASAPDARPRL